MPRTAGVELSRVLRACFLQSLPIETVSDVAGHVHDHLVEAVNRAAFDSRGATRVVELLVGDQQDVAPLRRVLGRRVAALGFLPLRASRELSDDRKRQLAHRHLALLASAPADNDAVLAWLRVLPAVSPRAHLIVIFKAAVHLHRAERFDRRGRYAQAERWYRAALESARRRGDEVGQVKACRKVVEHLLRRDEWEEARRLARSLLDSLRNVGARAELAVVLAEVLLAQAELGQAEALLASTRIELAVAELSPPTTFDDVLAELRFWQGRPYEAAATVAGGPVTVRRLMVEGAAAFLRRDIGGLTRTAHEASSIASPQGEFCRRLFLLLRGAVVEERQKVGMQFDCFERQARAVGCPRLERLGRALALEACVVGGLPLPADSSAGFRKASARMPALDGAFLAWQQAVRSRDRALACQRAARLVQLGARVVETWRWGCSDMQLVHAIPVLLRVVQDAEDDLAALVAACSWIRKEAGADAVAFLDLDRTVIWGDGWTPPDSTIVHLELRDDGCRVVEREAGGILVVRAVRYAGAMTGSVAAYGPAERRDALVEAASTAAALCGPALRARVDLVKTTRASPALVAEILGCSPAIVALRESVVRAAVTPFPVLVEGESGTGKELVARAIHRLSPRRDRRFVAVNCAALTDDLFEAELFGHTRGAFTGAVGARTGLVEDAHGGTLFLDEAGELSPRAQAKLLRVLQEREVRRLGENVSRPVDARVVSATNRFLAEAVRQGSFREDLLFRLAVVRLRVPPLRDRVEDVPLLAHASWRSLAIQAGKRAILGPDAVAHLCRHPWPGNVRELQNAMAALLVIAPDRGRVGARHVGQVLSASSTETTPLMLPLHRTRANFERTTVAGALARHGGRRTAAARELGLTRQGLTKAMKRLGLSDGPETGVA